MTEILDSAVTDTVGDDPMVFDATVQFKVYVRRDSDIGNDLGLNRDLGIDTIRQALLWTIQDALDTGNQPGPGETEQSIYIEQVLSPEEKATVGIGQALARLMATG